MVERHYGAEMVDLLADPLLSGVYGGEATQLSVRAVLPRFADMEAKHAASAAPCSPPAEKWPPLQKPPRARCSVR